MFTTAGVTLIPLSICKQNAPPQDATDIFEKHQRSRPPPLLPRLSKRGIHRNLAPQSDPSSILYSTHTEHPHPLFTHIDTYSGLSPYHQITR
ncbi:hypothetical protein EYC80_000458 [Monilinia laxa]|uniref:Uncharacterized protein n=1 Tax=Monilinia laxa TaxID=61186 RepID=A0A5N6KAU8_MONLA|nr:hypothetical protein EYC80_000458 [Monilinia laxa]